ncbi:septum formation initiator family protein [Corynebacterium sp. 4HC-13]|uniref:Septum formation initiator family protein n=2 Tax=Corynebacterium anserum TaxID=2684406 RepID=A0A7G7YR73_9CORY|nr:septum formation initiator family protein [Corynebacterium anserum]QNH96993.1 septum formation initiator family protein [Corynebacterium anserum]
MATEKIEAQREAERVIVARDRDAAEIAKAQRSRTTKVNKEPEGVEPSDLRQRLPRARSVERQEHLRERAQAVPARIARSFKQLPQKVNPAVLTVAAFLVIFLAVSIAPPLRNYFSQRAELAELNAQIDHKTQQRDQLTEELNRYNNNDYIREQARTRLGLIEPGESVYRILSPKIQANPAGSTPGVEEEQGGQRGEWYEQLWDAIATPPPEEKPTGNHVIDNQLPTVPEDNSGHNQ